MYSYNEREQTLKIFRKDLKNNFEVSLLDPILASYKQYRTETVKDDILLLFKSMSEEFNVDIQVSNIDIRLSDADMLENAIPDDKRFYTVTATLDINGVTRPNIEVFRIPYMDDNGLYGGKIIVHELLRLEELSYDDVKKVLTLVLPNRVLPIAEETDGLKWQGYGKTKLHIYFMLLTLLVESGMATEDNVKSMITNIFVNSQMRKYANKFFEKLPYTMIDVSDRFAGDDGTLLNRIQSDQYLLGRTRTSINMHFSLDRTLGLTLAEQLKIPKTGSYLPAGTLIDATVLKILKEGYVSRIVVDYLPKILGRELADNIIINVIKKGTEVTDFLSNEVPELMKYRYVREDIKHPIVIRAGTKLTEAHLKFMHSSGLTEVLTNDGPLPYLFKHEIITNNTVALTDIFPNGALPSGCIYKHTDKLYIPTVLKFSGMLEKAVCSENLRELFMPDKLTMDDIIALVGYAIGIINMPETFYVYSRDEDFVKKVYTVNDTLSNAFRKHISQFLRSNITRIKGFIFQRYDSSDKIFRSMSDLVRQHLYESTIVRPADHTNPIALMTSIRQVGTIAARANITQRSIVMGHFGRLDPYETPAGKKIGLNTTLPVHCRIVDGKLETAYHPIECRNGQSFVSTNVEWLTQLEEFGKRFGDIMSIETTGDLFDSPIIPKKIPARVPAASNSDEKITADMSLSTELDYVTTTAEQTIGCTAMLIPFIGADDGVRVGYALSMLKQAVYIVGSEPPLVTTSMYKDIFRENDTFIVKAKEDGKVLGIVANRIFTGEDDSIAVKEMTVRGKSLTVLDYRVKPGESFKKGDILADSTMSRDGYFSPGANLLVAFMPYYGFNNEDALPVTTRAAYKFTSLDVNNIENETRVTPNDRLSVIKPEKKFINEGDTVFSIQRTSSKFRSDSEPIKVTAPIGKSGILLNLDREVNPFSITHRASLINFAELSDGDKIVGRHGNKSTISAVFKSSEFPMFKNGVVVDTCQNPCGLPSRMNLGQQLEAHLGFVAYMLGIKCESDGFNGASVKEIAELWEFVYDCSNESNFSAVIGKWQSILPSGLIKQAMSRLEFMAHWKGCFLLNGKAILINQLTGKQFVNPIAFGIGYYVKLFHQVDHKMHERGGLIDVDYTQLEKQPPKGSSKGGGQRLGEMEFDVINAYGAYEIAREAMNDKSDNVDMRERRMPIMLDDSANVRDIDLDMHGTAPRCSETLRYNLEALGIDMNYTDGYPLEKSSLLQRRRMRVQKMPTTVVSVTSLPPEVLADIAKYGDD